MLYTQIIYTPPIQPLISLSKLSHLNLCLCSEKCWMSLRPVVEDFFICFRQTTKDRVYPGTFKSS